MAKVGRPKALDAFNREQFCNLIMLGCDWRTAAWRINCKPITVRREANRDPEFDAKWRRAELTLLTLPLYTLREEATKNWRAAAWQLERIYPSKYFKQNPRNLTLETMEEMLSELFEEIASAIPSAETREAVRKRIGRMGSLWERDWTPNKKLKNRNRLSPEKMEDPTGKGEESSTSPVDPTLNPAAVDGASTVTPLPEATAANEPTPEVDIVSQSAVAESSEDSREVELGSQDEVTETIVTAEMATGVQNQMPPSDGKTTDVNSTLIDVNRPKCDVNST